MSTFEIHCETCPFDTDAPTIADALGEAEKHKRRHGVEHRVTIRRLQRP